MFLELFRTSRRFLATVFVFIFVLITIFFFISLKFYDPTKGFLTFPVTISWKSSIEIWCHYKHLNTLHTGTLEELTRTQLLASLQRLDPSTTSLDRDHNLTRCRAVDGRE